MRKHYGEMTNEELIEILLDEAEAIILDESIYSKFYIKNIKQELEHRKVNYKAIIHNKLHNE
jgi:hypothetical protein